MVSYFFSSASLSLNLGKSSLRRIDLLQISNRLFGSFRVAFTERGGSQARKRSHIVTPFQKRRAIPFFGNVVMARIEVYQTKRNESLIVIGLELIRFQ